MTWWGTAQLVSGADGTQHASSFPTVAHRHAACNAVAAAALAKRHQ